MKKGHLTEGQRHELFDLLGANENTNGLIRQYFPKGTDFATITPEQVQWMQDRLNARPRKRLGYMSPKENFKQLTSLDYSAVALSA